MFILQVKFGLFKVLYNSCIMFWLKGKVLQVLEPWRNRESIIQNCLEN
jgi:hypothetical protein